MCRLVPADFAHRANAGRKKGARLPRRAGNEKEQRSMETVSVVNRTMELAQCSGSWTFNRDYDCWCLEDVLYTPVAAVPASGMPSGGWSPPSTARWW